MINPYTTAHAIFYKFFPEVRADLTDDGASIDAAAERVIALADDYPGFIFHSAILSEDDYWIVWDIVRGRVAALAKPIIGWIYIEASEQRCADQDAEDNRDAILSQAWICWRTAEAAMKAAEQYMQEYYDGADQMRPIPHWQPDGGFEGAMRWILDDDSGIVVEVYPLRLQD